MDTIKYNTTVMRCRAINQKMLNTRKMWPTIVHNEIHVIIKNKAKSYTTQQTKNTYTIQ